MSGLGDDRTRNPPLRGESLADFVDRTNHEWVVAFRRLSPQLMIEILEWLGPAADRLWQFRDLSDPSTGVSWAGVDPAPVWLDAAREVTDHWVHERQLREAVGDEGVGSPPLGAVLDVFARGLPNTLSRLEADDPDRIALAIGRAVVALRSA